MFLIEELNVKTESVIVLLLYCPLLSLEIEYSLFGEIVALLVVSPVLLGSKLMEQYKDNGTFRRTLQQGKPCAGCKNFNIKKKSLTFSWCMSNFDSCSPRWYR